MITQERQGIMKNSDKTWSIAGGNGNLLQYSCLYNPIDTMKRQKDMTPEDELPRLEGVQCTTVEEWKAVTNSARKK